MGWLLCLIMLVGWVWGNEPLLLVVAGLFSISGAISEVATALRNFNNAKNANDIMKGGE